MNRGDRREPIFRDDEDRTRFLSTLGEACAKTGWQEQVGERIGTEHYGEERHESQLDQAERPVLDELWRHKLQDSDLSGHSKGDARKIEIAQRLREETMVTVKWVAGRLHMGSVAYVTNRLYLKRKSNAGMRDELIIN